MADLKVFAGLAVFFQSRVMRSGLYMGYRIYARAVIGLPKPKIFLNSNPKSGTHLVHNILGALPHLMFSGVFLRIWDVHAGEGRYLSGDAFALDREKFERALKRTNYGQFMTSHLPYSPQAAECLKDCGYVSLFMIRDLRDVITSNLRYCLGLKRHRFHDRLHAEFTSDEERFLALLQGVPDTKDFPNASIHSVAAEWRQRVGWLKDKGCLVVRFEDLVGGVGGGDDDTQRRTIAVLASHVKRPLDKSSLDKVISRGTTRKSHTFRRGVIGDWRNHFSPRVIDVFKQVAGQTLIDYGYERDFSW